MTEEQWLAATDPRPIVEALRAGGNDNPRKLWLFALACCRRVWPLLTDERSRRAVEVAERYAGGRASEEQLREACSAAMAASDAASDAAADAEAAYEADPSTALAYAIVAAPHHAAYAGWLATSRTSDAVSTALNVAGEAADAAAAAAYAAGDDSSSREQSANAARAAEQKAQAAFIRDLFGSPFRPPLLPPQLTWRSGLIPRLAEAIYENRILPNGHLDLARLGVLADALEEAGCTDQDILGHLREPGAVHFRGRHLVDRILGKE
jgi:hypothetical protein